MRGHGETDGPRRVRETARPCASARGHPCFPLDRGRDRSSGARAPPARRGAARRARLPARTWAGAAGAASAWGAESRKPGRGAANSDNSEAKGALIHRALLLPEPHGSPPCPRGGTWSRGSRFLSLWAAAAGIRGREASREARLCLERRRGRPRAGRGRGARTRGERACACVSAPTVGARSPRLREHPPGLLPSLRSPCPLLPSDSAAPKANGEGASFKVHINLALVGYSLAATKAVRKGVVPTAPSEPLLAPAALPPLAQGPRWGEL